MSDLEALLRRFEGVQVSDRNDAVTVFASICGCDRASAQFFLEASSFQLEAAVNLFLNSQDGASGGAARVGQAFHPTTTFSGEEEAVDEDLQAAIALSMAPFAASPAAPAARPAPAGSSGDSMEDMGGSGGAGGGSGQPATSAPQVPLAPGGFHFSPSTFKHPAQGSPFQQQPQQQLQTQQPFIFGQQLPQQAFGQQQPQQAFGQQQQQPQSFAFGGSGPAAAPVTAQGPRFGTGSSPPTFSFSSSPPQAFGAPFAAQGPPPAFPSFGQQQQQPGGFGPR